MTTIRACRLFARALYELFRADTAAFVSGSPVPDQLPARRHVEPAPGVEQAIVDALRSAIGFYCKPVRCLQRSVCLARVLRDHGLDARLVIGYRPMPFASHAWVAIDDRVIGDSAAYPEQLRVLVRI